METRSYFKAGKMNFENGILQIQYCANTVIDEDLLIEQIICRRGLTRNEEFCMLVDLRNAIDVTYGAQVLAAENPFPDSIKAIALVTNPGLDHTRAKLYSLFDRPNIATKAFLSKEEAKEWFANLEQHTVLRKAG